MQTDFHSNKNSSLHFRKFPLANRTAICGIFKKEDNLERYTQIFGNFLLGISVPPDITGIFGWLVRFSEIQQFPDFLETFPRNFLAHLNWYQSSLIRKFWLNGRRPKCRISLSYSGMRTPKFCLRTSSSLVRRHRWFSPRSVWWRKETRWFLGAARMAVMETGFLARSQRQREQWQTQRGTGRGGREKIPPSSPASTSRWGRTVTKDLTVLNMRIFQFKWKKSCVRELFT